MSDKLRKLYPLSAVFGPGEQPSAAKLSGISTQANAAFSIVEKAIGDIWNEAGDPVLSPTSDIAKNALFIPTLGRSLGSMSALNSLIPGTGILDSNMSYTDAIGGRYGNHNIGYLKYPCADIPNVGNIILGGSVSPLVQGQFISTPSLMTNPGDWSVTTDGRFHSMNPIPFGLTVTYRARVVQDIKAADNTAKASWNVIPDQSTWIGNYAGIKISLVNNSDTSQGYHIWLPPRKPLGATKIVPGSLDSGSSNIQTNPDSGTLLAWQDSSVDAALTNGAHYRYNFPSEISASLLGSGTLLPSSFIYIWDNVMGTILEGVLFYIPANIAHVSFKLKVTGNDLADVFGDTIGNGIITDDTTQLPSDYISRFKIITVGTSATKAISSLLKDHLTHRHTPLDGSLPLLHRFLVGLVTPGGPGTLHVGTSGFPAFGESNWIDDDHTQYLHRGGSTLSDIPNGRDSNDNYIWRNLVVSNPNNKVSGLLLTAVTNGIGALKPLTDPVDIAIQNFAGTSSVLIEGSTYIDSNGFGHKKDNIVLDVGSANYNAVGTASISRIWNATIDRLYFGPIGATVLPSNYITFIPESSTFRFVANDGFGDINGHSQIDTDFINSITGTFHSVVVLGSATVGNPSGYNYSLASGFGKEQYYMFSAIEFGSNLGDRNLSSAGSFRNASATSTGTLPYISGEIGPSTSGTTPPCLYASPLRLPHGAILNQSSRLDAYFVGNGNTLFPISIGIYYASQSFSATPIPLYFIQSNEVGNTILQSGTSGDAVHSIDNQNNYYFVKISLPADPSLGSLPASKFFSARLNYFMPSVNN